MTQEEKIVKIVVRKNGPYRVYGSFQLVDYEDNAFQLPTDKEFISLCRCGASENKPFCDGSHHKINFQADTKAKK
ncbi:MAG: CDGSH iron-sulfur domain-containing protein [Nitrososphaerota archaeon]|nr:CDGSH iron-sulfur domain-containing protein [Aigarchaeota archaeon]MDW8076475.1 CDGSH iron-sulfur domain-containing protein [Nitrososphaerota archaeon]